MEGFAQELDEAPRVGVGVVGVSEDVGSGERGQGDVARVDECQELLLVVQDFGCVGYFCDGGAFGVDGPDLRFERSLGWERGEVVWVVD